MGKSYGRFLIIASVAMAIIFVVVAAQRPLSTLENVLLQIVTLALGLAGSYLFGQYSARQGAQDLIRPHARSAFRRLLSLYASLSRLAVTLQDARSDGSFDHPRLSVLDKLEAIVTEQIATADDAVEDWRDIVPEEFEELSRRIAAKQKEKTL